MPLPASATVAVIGAGVAGCAVVAQLRRLGVSGSISLWETGRGPGGRASTRRSRGDSQLVIDHGAPLLHITGTPPPQSLQPLLEGGWLEPWPGPVAMLEGESRLNIGRPDALGMGLLLLYLILLFRAVRIAGQCQRPFGSLVAVGLALLLVMQAMVNMAVAVNLVPVTGQPLPLVSMGGTSIWFTCLAIGIILSVSRSLEDEPSTNTDVKRPRTAVA